jgi:hypothetical protein
MLTISPAASGAASVGIETLNQHLLGDLGNKLSLGGQTETPTPTAREAKAPSSTADLQQVLQQLLAQLQTHPIATTTSTGSGK